MIWSVAFKHINASSDKSHSAVPPSDGQEGKEGANGVDRRGRSHLLTNSHILY